MEGFSPTVHLVWAERKVLKRRGKGEKMRRTEANKDSPKFAIIRSSSNDTWNAATNVSFKLASCVNSIPRLEVKQCAEGGKQKRRERCHFLAKSNTRDVNSSTKSMNGLFLNLGRVAGGWHMVPDVRRGCSSRKKRKFSISVRNARQERDGETSCQVFRVPTRIWENPGVTFYFSCFSFQLIVEWSELVSFVGSISCNINIGGALAFPSIHAWGLLILEP